MKTINEEIKNKKFHIKDNIIVVDNIRNKFIMTFNPFSIRNINDDVINIIKLINEGLSFEKICDIKNFSDCEKEKLEELMCKLYINGIIEVGKKKKQYILRKSTLSYPLERLFISITENCNLKCSHCYVQCNEENNSEKNMLLDQILDCVDQGLELGVWQVDLTGGEIFCRKDIFIILDYLEKKNVRVNLFTNATLIDEGKVDKLKKYSNITKIIISFDSLSKQIYENFRKVNGSFDKLINAMNLLKAANIKMSFNVPYIDENKDEIGTIVSFLSKNYSKDVVIYPIFPLGRGSEIKQIDSMRGFVDIKKKAMEVAKSEGDRFTNNLNTTCGVSESFIFVERTGQIALCPTLSQKYDLKLRIGNIKEDRLSDLWNNNEILNKFRVANCKYIENCSAKEECKGGCRCKAYFESGGSIYGNDYLSCLVNGAKLTSDQKKRGLF